MGKLGRPLVGSSSNPGEVKKFVGATEDTEIEGIKIGHVSYLHVLCIIIIIYTHVPSLCYNCID